MGAVRLHDESSYSVCHRRVTPNRDMENKNRDRIKLSRSVTLMVVLRLKVNRITGRITKIVNMEVGRPKWLQHNINVFG